MNANPLQASAPENNAVVKASAGVGKTYLLVTRLLRLLLQGARPDAILAVTFTRKAAGEMQTRLLERLYALTTAPEEELGALLTDIDEADTPEIQQRARHLFEQLLRHEASVKTTTFHAFCQDILRRFPLEADVPPGFELLDKSGPLEIAAWDALYADASRDANSPAAQALETLFDECGSLHGAQSALESFLAYRADWWAYTQAQSDPVSYAQTRLQKQLDTKPEHDPRTQLRQPNVLEELEEFTRLLSMHATATNTKLCQPLADALAQPEHLDELHSAAYNCFFKKDGKERSRKSSGAQQKSLGGEAAEQRMLELHSIHVQHLEQINDQRARQRCYLRSSAWYVAGTALLNHFQRIKSERRLLDFTDLEWKAYCLLNHSDNAQWVQYKFDQRIEHLLVDEFQDTNPTQWRLLLQLLQEMTQNEDKQRSVFLVGDDKQSIYSFRRADPRLLDQAGDWLQENLQARQYPMDKSRRSSPAIMQVVNNTFNHESFAQLLPGFQQHDTHHQDLYGEANLLPLIEPLEEDDDEHEVHSLRNPLHEPRKESGDNLYYREGQLIADKIQELIAQQTPIQQGNKSRACQYRDIMLLVRSRTHVRDYEQALREANIPYIGADRGTLLDAPEIQDMVSLFDVLITPFNNLALARVLKSPLFACSDDDLIFLRQHCPAQKSWAEWLLNEADHSSDALQRAATLLHDWQTLTSQLPIHDLVDIIFHRGDVIARYQAAYPVHLRQRAKQNLMRFLELALEIDSGRYPSTGRFLASLRELRSTPQDAPDEATPGEETNAVRILTIHASKGLEAPVLFIADASAGAPVEKGFRALINWPGEQRESEAKPDTFLLVGKKAELDSYSAQLIDELNQRQAQENANLLYVAITRARQYLFVSGCRQNRKKQQGWYEQIEQSWPRNDDDSYVTIIHQKPPSISTAIESKYHPEPEQNMHWLETVSQITSESDVSPSALEPEEEDSEWQDEAARKRGTAIHRFLEVLSTNADINIRELHQQVAHELNISSNDTQLQEWENEAQRVLSTPALAHLYNNHQAWNEVPIQYMNKGRMVHGIIDRVVLVGDVIYLIDYKTHRISDITALKNLADYYSPQLNAYAQGIQQIWPDKQLRAQLLFTHQPYLMDVNHEESNVS